MPRLTEKTIAQIQEIYRQAIPAQTPKITLEILDKSDAQESDISTLVSSLKNFPAAEQANYLNLLTDLIRLRFTVSFLIENALLWNTSETFAAFYTLAKRFGAQNENILIKYIGVLSERNRLTPPQIHRLLQLHLLWLPLPLDNTQPPAIRNAINLFEADPILFELILSGPIKIEGATPQVEASALAHPFSHKDFHDKGIRLDNAGNIFYSTHTITELNGDPRVNAQGEKEPNSNPHGRPVKSALVIALSPQNLDVALLQHYYAFWELILTAKNFLDKSLEECLTLFRSNRILSADLKEIESPQEIIALCLPYTAKSITTHFDLKQASKLDPRVSSHPSIDHLPADKREDAISLLNSVAQTPRFVPFIVHLLKIGFSTKQLKDFSDTLKRKLTINWTEGYCLDFLLQITPEKLTAETLTFITNFSTEKLPPTQAALALQNRFQFVIWFGIPLSDKTTFIHEITRQFFKKAGDPYLLPAMINWINTLGHLISPALTIDNLVLNVCYLERNEWTPRLLLSVIQQTAIQLGALTWHGLFRLLEITDSPNHLNNALRICKTVILSGEENSLTKWLKRYNLPEFSSLFINLLLKHDLLTAKEAADLYYEPKLNFPEITTYFDELKTQFLNKLESLPSVLSTTEDSTTTLNPVEVEKQITQQFSMTHEKLDIYQQKELHKSQRDDGSVVYEPKGFFSGAALIARNATRNAARAFTSYYGPISSCDALAVFQLLENENFREQTQFSSSNSFWAAYCKDTYELLSRIAQQLKAIACNPMALTTFLFDGHDHGNLDPFAITQLLKYCDPAIKNLIEEFIVYIRGGYGFSHFLDRDSNTLVNFSELTLAHQNKTDLTTTLPISLPLPSCAYPKPIDAQTAESKPIDQWHMSPDDLYQYEELDMLSGEQALALFFQDRIINVPENIRDQAINDTDNHTLFYLVRPINEFVLADPLYTTERDSHQFSTFQKTLRSLVDSYNPNDSKYKNPIAFIGVINTGNHYVAYVIGKSKNGHVFVYTVDPSPQTALLGTVEYKDGKGICPCGDKELSKRSMRRFFTSTLPGCDYQDIYVTQMLRERDCGPLSLYTVKEILGNGAITVTEDRVSFDQQALSIQARPCYSDNRQYFYPAAMETLSTTARTYWATIFKEHAAQLNSVVLISSTDTNADPQKPTVFESYESKTVMGNDISYEQRAKGQHDSDLRKQNQSELSLYLNLDTDAFAELKEKLRKSGELPSNDDILHFIQVLNEEITKKFPASKSTWDILYSTYLTRPDSPDMSAEENALYRENVLTSIREVIVYNLNATIKNQLLDNFKDYIRTNITLLSHDKIEEMLALFLQQAKQRDLYTCCTFSTKETLDAEFKKIASNKVIIRYINFILEQALNDKNIFQMLSCGITENPESDIVWNALLLSISAEKHPELHKAFHYLNSQDGKALALVKISEKVNLFYQEITEKTLDFIRKKFQEDTLTPEHLLHTAQYDLYQLTYRLLPSTFDHPILLSQDLDKTLLFQKIFIDRLLDYVKNEINSWIQISLDRKIVNFFELPDVVAFFANLSLSDFSRYIQITAGLIQLTPVFYRDFDLDAKITKSDKSQLTPALLKKYRDYITQHPIVTEKALSSRDSLFSKLAATLSHQIDSILLSEIIHDPNRSISVGSILEKLFDKNTEISLQKSLFINENKLTALGRQFTDYLEQEQSPFLRTIAEINQHYRLIEKKLNILVTLLAEYATYLENGGYSGRRNQALAIINNALLVYKKIQLDFNKELTVSYHSFILHRDNYTQDILNHLQQVSAELINLLRPGNCDPKSTTQPLRILLCQLLDVPGASQYSILNEVTAKALDEKIQERHALLLPTIFSVRTLSVLIAPESTILLIVPNDAKKLPDLYECGDLFELAARCIAWWRINHIGISTLQLGSFLDRARAPGGLSPAMVDLINTVNQADLHNIDDQLQRFVARYPKQATQKTTHSLEVIQCINENIKDLGLVFNQTHSLTFGSLAPILETETTSAHLQRIAKKHTQNRDSILEIDDIYKLIGHFKKRWMALCLGQKDNMPMCYLASEDELCQPDRAHLVIAKQLAKHISFNGGSHFKMPAGLLMPGTAYDQLIETKHRQYKPCAQLQSALMMDDDDDSCIDVIDDINANQLIIINGIPLNADWYKIAAGFASLATPNTPNGIIYTLHNPINYRAFTEEDYEELRNFGVIGSGLYALTVTNIPTERSLNALITMLHAMILTDGNTFNYSAESHKKLNSAYEKLIATIHSYPKRERDIFWNTQIPGLTSRSTISQTLGTSLRNDNDTGGNCTHGTGRTLALVIHQYFNNADNLLPRDARRAKMLSAFAVEFRYIDANRKTPLSDNTFKKTECRQQTLALKQ